MKNIILLLFSFAILFGCKQKPKYNPFDNQFNIDESYFKERQTRYYLGHLRVLCFSETKRKGTVLIIIIF